MGKPYSDDLRDRVVAAMGAGRSCRDVGSAFAVAPSTAGNWYRLYQRTKGHAARAMGGDRRSKLLEQADWIAGRLARASGLTLGEVRNELAERGIAVSYTSVWRMVRRLGLRHKKRTIFATEQDRLDVAIARDIWRAAQAGFDFTRLVFVDETGTTTSMIRLRGWGQKGKPLLGKAPHGHWMTSTFVAGLAHDGLLAPMLIDTPPSTSLRTGMTGLIFQQWLTDHLIPEMAPGSIVVCDNLPAHKVAGVRQCLEDAGMGLLYLPPYSPDFNPIEQVFAKVKALLRRAAPRSFDAICDALKAILERFKPAECSNYLRHSGYVQT